MASGLVAIVCLGPHYLTVSRIEVEKEEGPPRADDVLTRPTHQSMDYVFIHRRGQLEGDDYPVRQILGGRVPWAARIYIKGRKAFIFSCKFTYNSYLANLALI